MRVAAAVAALLAGALLLIVTRFVFPTCEQLGRGRMHCTDAAHTEYAAGALLVLSGVGLFLVRRRGPSLALAAAAAAVCVAAALAPAWTGYCSNPDMPCNYGMVPSARFLAVLAGLIELAAVVSLARPAVKEET